MSNPPNADSPATHGSLWEKTATPVSEYSTLAGEVAADVCIVGAGFTGLSAALHLAEAGTNVAVVEARDIGWGASGRTGGHVIAGLKRDPDEVESVLGVETGAKLVDASGRAPDLVFELIRRHDIDCDAIRPGWIQPAHNARAMAAVEDRAAQWARRGAKPEILDRGRIAALLGTEFYAGGWCDRRGGHLQPLSYVRGLGAAAARAGAAIYINSSATELSRIGGRWRVVTANGVICAESVILATNGYTDGLWPGLERTVVPVYSMQVATQPLSENVRRSILPKGHGASDSFHLLHYFRLDRTGRFIMGGRGPNEDRPGIGNAGELTKAVGRIFPQIGSPTFEYAWGGRIAITLDHLPQLHELAPGLYAGLGYNGRGVAMATMMGKCLADIIVGTPAADLPVPITAPRPIPFHALRRPAAAAITAWWHLRDRMESG